MSVFYSCLASENFESVTEPATNSSFIATKQLSVRFFQECYPNLTVIELRKVWLTIIAEHEVIINQNCFRPTVDMENYAVDSTLIVRLVEEHRFDEVRVFIDKILNECHTVAISDNTLGNVMNRRLALEKTMIFD